MDQDTAQLSLKPPSARVGSASESERAAALRLMDRLLAELPVGGDRERIFEQIYALYGDAVLVFFLRRGFSREDSHDLRQETFMNLFRGIGTFEGRSNFDTWLFGIAANVWRNRLRAGSALCRTGKEVSLPPNESEEVVGPRVARSEQEDRVAASELRIRLSRALAQLPPKMRRCALLRFSSGLKYREIAVLTGTSVGTAKAQIHQARDRLRDHLGDMLGNASID